MRQSLAQLRHLRLQVWSILGMFNLEMHNLPFIEAFTFPTAFNGSVDTARTRLNKAGLEACRSVKQQELLPRTRALRLQFCHQYGWLGCMSSIEKNCLIFFFFLTTINSIHLGWDLCPFGNFIIQPMKEFLNAWIHICDIFDHTNDYGCCKHKPACSSHLTENDWKNTLFCDEKSFRSDTDGRFGVWRPKGTRFQEGEKFFVTYLNA